MEPPFPADLPETCFVRIPRTGSSSKHTGDDMVKVRRWKIPSSRFDIIQHTEITMSVFTYLLVGFPKDNRSQNGSQGIDFLVQESIKLSK